MIRPILQGKAHTLSGNLKQSRVATAIAKNLKKSATITDAKVEDLASKIANGHDLNISNAYRQNRLSVRNTEGLQKAKQYTELCKGSDKTAKAIIEDFNLSKKQLINVMKNFSLLNGFDSEIFVGLAKSIRDYKIK